MSITTQPIKVRNEETMDSLLRDLQPIIHYTALLIRLIQWKDKKQSLLLFLSLIIWRKLNTCILCLLPLFGLILIKFYKDFTITTSTNDLQPPPQQQQQKQKELIKDLTEIRNILYLITSIKHWIQESDTLCRAYYQYYSISTAKTRSIILFGVTSVVAIIYAGWIILLYQQIITGASSLLWFMVLIIMSLSSPWVSPIYTASVRAISPLIYSFHLTTTKDDKKVEEQDEAPKQEYMNGYCFEIYHHQRRWGPAGWCNLLLRSDVPPWTDIHLEPTPSIYQFQLPPTTYIGKPNERNQQKMVSWIWVDPAWTIQKDGTYKNGWQYGNWKWKSWSSQSGGIMNCTRRQKWSRYAQRKESWVDVKIESCCSSVIGGSATDGDSSVYNWDNPSSTSRSSSIY